MVDQWFVEQCHEAGFVLGARVRVLTFLPERFSVVVSQDMVTLGQASSSSLRKIIKMHSAEA